MRTDEAVCMIGLDRVSCIFTEKYLKSVDNLNIAVACHPTPNEGIPEYLLPSFLPTQNDLRIKNQRKAESRKALLSVTLLRRSFLN